MPARKKYQKRDDEHVATYEGELVIGDIILPCAVLDDGKRILPQQGVLQAIGRAKKAKGGEGVMIDGKPAFLRAMNLQPFISDDLWKSTNYIPYHTKQGAKGFGYGADILPLLCEVYIDANKAGVLNVAQKRIAEKCEILYRGFARVGIAALIDEATGYQYERARSALEEILNKFIASELRKWTRTFPTEYYRELFRLRGWRLIGGSTKRPAQAGKDTSNLIYERLAPGILEELRNLNPKLPSGQRRHKHHQWLTEDVGDPRLREHIHAVVGLMKASDTWGQFKALIDKAFPKYPSKFQHPQLPFRETMEAGR